MGHTENTGDVKIMEFFAWRCASTLLGTHKITQRSDKKKKNNKEISLSHTHIRERSATTTGHRHTKVQLFSENSERTDKKRMKNYSKRISHLHLYSIYVNFRCDNELACEVKIYCICSA